MSKAVLISIQPRWCELIANGKKTLEVRKSRPKLKIPFKCYIYCTKCKDDLWIFRESYRYSFSSTISTLCSAKDVCGATRANGKVIGEFICDTYVIDRTFGHNPFFNASACMSEIDAAVYSCKSPIYGWHITDLKIYDVPKELSEFGLSRPPQSWQYVEEQYVKERMIWKTIELL